MLKSVLVTCVLLSATGVSAEEEWMLGSGCYTQAAMREVVQLPEADGMLLMFQYIRDGKCAPTITAQSDWSAGPGIRDTGVKAAYASVYNWARGDLPATLPAKQVMYFDASVETTASD